MAEGSEAPSLKIDVGFSLESLGPKVSFEVPLNFMKQPDDGRSLPVSGLRTWWNARRDGKRGIPDYSEAELSSFEKAVHRSQGVKVEQLDTEAQVILLKAADQVGQCRPPSFNADSAVAAAKHSVFGWLNTYRGVLRMALQKVRECKAEYEAEQVRLKRFSVQKELVNDKPMSRMSIFDRIGILMLASFLEALISMVLFFDVSEFGYAGGAAYALVISMANVIAGIAIGFAATYAFNIKKTREFMIIAVAIMTALSVLVVWMNLSVAHFREKSVFDLQHVMPQTAMSGVLLVVGLTVWAYAVYKGWSDFVPDHVGHRDLWASYDAARRREEAARHDYERLAATLRASALNELDGIRTRIGAWEADHVRRLDFIRSIVRAVEAVQRILPDIRANIVASCEQILRKYRETNYTVRRKSGEKSLKLKYTANPPQGGVLDIKSVIVDAQETERTIQDNQKELARFRDLFEHEVASRLTGEIEKIETEAEQIRAPTT